MSKIYIIPGPPVPLQRARFGKARVYSAQKDLRASWEIIINTQHGTAPLLSGPQTLTITFFMPIPSKQYTRKQDSRINKPHYYRPDLSNLIKWVEDCCNGIVITDDALIASINAQKVYSETPRTEFSFSPYYGINDEKTDNKS